MLHTVTHTQSWVDVTYVGFVQEWGTVITPESNKLSSSEQLENNDPGVYSV
jgi:hypothetical protein